ncbi:hypothetical protein J1605_018370 [Eschrichtius robustus]|uniref:Small ribosomal subunit protein eS8 n=1 Tax=Eschrichtius robustus TaxID=9764 RepID=A0AB34HW23_ESCRO|nr:hypothetical protein J1605_018370 [Eschrichtius robustus]
MCKEGQQEVLGFEAGRGELLLGLGVLYTQDARIIDVVYNATNNKQVRTKTLVKNCIMLIDSTPYRQWYKSHYALPLGRKKGAKLTPEEEEILNKKRSKNIQKKYDERGLPWWRSG